MIPTDIFALVIASLLVFIFINSSASGWSIGSVSSNAPALLPCDINEVVVSYSCEKLAAPLEALAVLLTLVPLGLRYLRVKPTPPPFLYVSAHFLAVSNMEGILSSGGAWTKQFE